MKFSDPQGIITITRDFKMSTECAIVGSKVAEYLVIIYEWHKIDWLIAHSHEKMATPEPKLKQLARESQFQPDTGKETMRVLVDPAEPTGKYVMVGAGHSEK